MMNKMYNMIMNLIELIRMVIVGDDTLLVRQEIMYNDITTGYAECKKAYTDMFEGTGNTRTGYYNRELAKAIYMTLERIRIKTLKLMLEQDDKRELNGIYTSTISMLEDIETSFGITKSTRDEMEDTRQADYIYKRVKLGEPALTSLFTSYDENDIVPLAIKTVDTNTNTLREVLKPVLMPVKHVDDKSIIIPELKPLNGFTERHRVSNDDIGMIN